MKTAVKLDEALVKKAMRTTKDTAASLKRAIAKKTSVELDDELVRKAMELTNITTKDQLLNTALKELVRYYRNMQMLDYKDSGVWEGEMRATL
ncbi:hypothetical protein FACS1894139_16360 [Planctomycetales bacterium]|nr:hypothetical protein FACS1894139_16360 [Planctomycetales bacterium]GHV23817.1 hypothetical protein AGMMS49959_18230 [Planctomycetales bacterium]